MWKKYWIFLCTFLFISMILCENDIGRNEEGISRGFMPFCPGSTKPATIARSQLKHVFFMVQGNGRSRAKYTYWTAADIANDPRINFTRNTVLIALGYLDSAFFPIGALLANEYEAMGYNVILLDNQRFATVHYFMAARLMRPVGYHVAEVLVQLTKVGLDPDKLEIVGFSLGGQTAGFIGKSFQQLTGRNVGKITALEPSGPCFRSLGPEYRLNATDADFVEVIHTNCEGFGMAAKMGHVDFYINGGDFQPSDISQYPCTVTCSHFRVLSLWIAALRNPKKFIALKCNSIQEARNSNCYKNGFQVNYLGLSVDKTNHGVFYVSTGLDYPFFLGIKGLREEYVYWNMISDVNSGNETEIYV